MRDWPQSPAIYQIYPRSFRDSTGTGEGDLGGITESLESVAELGVDAVWLSPFFVSPFADGGYDVVDHRAVDPRFGTMEDFEALVARAHDLGLLVMIDQVLNHTSCDHPLFLAAIDGDDTAADCYLWRDPKPDGTQPNNWLSQFGPPGWTWNHKRRQYYFHQFLACQPSLNLRHPRVRDMHCAEIRFWRDKGVDGFRFDAVTSYLWDKSLADNPPATPEVQDKVSGANFVPYTYQDHVHDMLPGDGADYTLVLREAAGPGAYLIGESTSGNKSLELALAFTGEGRLDGCYTIDLPETGGDARTWERVFETIPDLSRFPKWLSSHDQPRHLSRAGDGSPRDAAFFAVMMAVLPGPWLIYQGEELALPQPDLSREETTDPLDLLYWPDGPGREGARVPIPWEADEPRYGFTEGKPWLPMRWESDRAMSAQNERTTRGLYARALRLRREHRWGEGRVTGWTREGETLRIDIDVDGQPWQALFNYGRDTVEAGRDGVPVLESQTCEAGFLGRTSAIWRL